MNQFSIINQIGQDDLEISDFASDLGNSDPASPDRQLMEVVKIIPFSTSPNCC